MCFLHVNIELFVYEFDLHDYVDITLNSKFHIYFCYIFKRMICMKC